MKTIYTFDVRITTDGTLSVEADSPEQASMLREQIMEWQCAIANPSPEGIEVFIDATPRLEERPDHPGHMTLTPRENARDNMSALEEREIL